MKLIPEQQVHISELIQELNNGAVIVYPTETCYGLGCDATNPEAVERLFQIKQRQQEKTVLVLMSDIAMAKEYVVWTSKLEELAERYWPGPLTVVSEALVDGFPKGVVGDDGTLAFRVTSHPLAHDIVEALGKPFVSTSANIARMESPYDIQTVLDMYANTEMKPDIVIDAGNLPQRNPSTIVRVLNGQVQVLRQGELVVDEN
ncbi:MAG: L-threonylcarbamoyladenylate synthase [Candidatus Magasanikbacteria bacterium]